MRSYQRQNWVQCAWCIGRLRKVSRLKVSLRSPAGYVEGKKYPFLVLPHGGPEANDVLGFDSTARTIAGLGYVVLQPEYRRSAGYGAEFMSAIYQHFGDRAYQDVDSATDYAIAQGWADPHRLAIFGWSAGGLFDRMDGDTDGTLQSGNRRSGNYGLGALPADERHCTIRL